MLQRTYQGLQRGRLNGRVSFFLPEVKLDQREYLMSGRVSERRRTSVKPACLKADNSPVKTKTSTALPFLGSTGYPSTILAPLDLVYSTEAFRSSTVKPLPRWVRATKKHTTDQTSSSSTGLRTRERARV